VTGGILARMTTCAGGRGGALAAMALTTGAVLAACGTTSTSGGSSPAGGSSESSSGGTVRVSKGQEMKASNGESVTVSGFVPNYPNGYSTLAAGDQCIKVRLSLNNGSSGDWGYPQNEFTVVDAGGKSHRAGASGTACPGSAGPVDLAAGHRDDTMVLTFEVPSSGALTLNWSPLMLRGETYQTPLE